MTRLQENTIERLALQYGSLHVRDGYTDMHVQVTAPRGTCWHLTEDGVPHQQLGNYSVDWSVR